MTTIHNLGFPRIGAKRELKFALEAYWKGESTAAELQEVAKALRARHWQNQAGFDHVYKMEEYILINREKDS